MFPCNLKTSKEPEKVNVTRVTRKDSKDTALPNKYRSQPQLNKSLDEEEDECSTTAGSGKSTGRKNSKIYKRQSDVCYALNMQERQGNLLAYFPIFPCETSKLNSNSSRTSRYSQNTKHNF